MQRIVQVDAFTAERYRGNPAAVCVLEGEADAGWMQDVASEMNLSETAFLRRGEDGVWGLRWFTPAVEVKLCGHATLASAHALWDDGLAAEDETLRFRTLSGELRARRRGAWIELDFPAQPPRRADAPPELLEALGVEARWVGRNEADYLVEVGTEAEVREAAPDMGRLRRVDVRGVIVTSAASTPGYDFVSRFFGPAVGVDEDPVTGSAHTCLGPFWGERLGREEMTGYQASRRGGVVKVRLAGDRVALLGQAVTVLRGELL